MRVCSRFHGFRDWLISKRWIWALTALACGTCLGRAQSPSYSIQLQPGFNSIANHLAQGGNRLDEVIPNAPADSQLYKFDPITQSYYTPATFLPGFGWFAQEPEMEYLKPGEGAFLFVNQSAVLTFSGAITQFPLPRQAVFGRYNFVSAHEPRTMNFAELFGFPPAEGDIVYLYDQPFASNPDLSQQHASSTHRFLRGQGWDRTPSFKPSRSAFVLLSHAPRIMQQPRPQIANAGDTVRLEVSLLGNGPFSYQWHFNDDALAGETNLMLILANIQYLQSGHYSVTVKNAFGETTGKPASIRVDSPPLILDPPRPIRTTPGQTVELRVRAVGSPTLRYQWFRNNQPMPNATGPMLNETANITAQYHVRVTNIFGSAQSTPVVLEVNDPPTILQQPLSLTVPPRDTAIFSAVAKGTQPLRYQWRRNGENLKDETNATLEIREVTPSHSGVYQVLVWNIAGAVHSDAAELKVSVPDLILTDRIGDSRLYEMPAFTGRGHNIGATNETNEVHCGRVGGSSVWLRWMTREHGIVRFETSGSGFDTVMAAYAMSRAGELTEVVCDDDEGEFLGSRIHFAALPDAMYFIAIDGLDGARGQILLDWQLEPTLETLPVILEQPRDQTVPLGGQATFSVLATGDPTFYIWYRDGIELPGQNQSRLVISPVKREDLGTYYVEIYQDNRFMRSRRALLQVSMADMDTRLLQAFAVDKFADAVDRRSTGSLRSVSVAGFTPALGYTGTQIFSTVGFGGEPGELSHCGIPGGSSAWFTFIPAANGQLHLNTIGSSFNTVLGVYTGPGPTIASLTPLICDDDSGPGTTSSLSFPATRGTVYYIAVDGYNGLTGSAQLNYRLLVPLILTNMTKTNDTICSLRVTATPAYPFTIQRCSGFQIWTPVLTTNSVTGTYEYRDTNATPLRRFYRAIQTP